MQLRKLLYGISGIAVAVGIASLAIAQQAARTQKTRTQAAPASTPIVQPAIAELQKALFVHCSNATYATPFWDDLELRVDDREPSSYRIHQSLILALDQPVFRPVSWALTRADVLNGIDWIGELVLTASAERTLPSEEWVTPGTRRHIVAEETRSRRTDIEGTCSKCVPVEHEVISIGAYRAKGTWHYFIPDTGGNGEDVSGSYTSSPVRGAEINLSAIGPNKTSSCADISETPEYKKAQEQAAIEAERKLEEQQRKEEETRRIEAQAAALRRQQIGAVLAKSRTPQTDLERKTSAEQFWQDSRTGLMWAATDTQQSCKSVHAGGQSDWRVAEIDELQSISDPSASHDLVFTGDIFTYHIAGGIILQQPVIIAAHPDIPPPGPIQGQVVRNGTAIKGGRLPPRPNVWAFDFRAGKRSMQSAGYGPEDVLCVRGSGHNLQPMPVSEPSVGPIDHAGGAVTPPAVLTKVDPEYSLEARQKKIAGTVTILCVVSPQGKAQDIKVVKSLGFGLDEKAVEAVQKWLFNPGKKNGVPVNVQVSVEVNFRLLDGPVR